MNTVNLGSAAQTARACEKLAAVLTAFAGASGFRALLTRALTLAKLQAPSLAGVQVLEDGSLTGFDEMGAETSLEEAGGGQVLVAQLLDLLNIFIGKQLTLRLVQDAWPDASSSGLRSKTEDTDT